jgi:hypothetical protein
MVYNNLFDYANCKHFRFAHKIEKIQHKAARIIAGLPNFSSLESLYFETGWEEEEEN